MLSPYQRGATLTDEELERLHAAITGVLGDAVERLVPLSTGGLTTKAARGYAVHDRLGEPCPRCGDIIRRVSFEEHTVFYCADLPDRRPDARRQASVTTLTGIDPGTARIPRNA